MPSERRHGLITCLSLTVFFASPTSLASLTLTQIAAPQFGLLASGASGRHFVLNTDSTVSGTHSGDYLSGAAAGRFTVEDTNSPASINIAVALQGSTGGLNLQEAMCSYGGSAQQACSGSGITVISSASAALKLGLEITTSTTHSGGDTAAAILELTVSYL